MKTTYVFDRLLEATVNPVIRGVSSRGGTRSSKTWSMLQLLFLIAEKSEAPLLISCVTDTMPGVKRGMFRDFKRMLQDEGLWNGKAMNLTEMTYTFPNGSQIEFFGCENAAKVFGPARDILFVNEAQRVPKEVFRQIIEDFEYCISHTMDKGDTSKGYQYGRLTKDACHGFLAKVYLWLGSVAQRDGKEILGNAADNFEKSLEHSSAVIQGGRYKLVDYYPDVFNAKTRDKAPDEVLWCVQGLTGDDTGTWTGMMFGIRGNQNLGGSWDNISSSDYHRMMYEPSDSIRRLWNCPRMTIQDDGTLWGWDYNMYWDTRGDQKLSEATENNNWLQWSIGKFRRYPLADPSSYNYTNFGMDEPLLRYADVLLMYAEAYNEVNHAPGDYRPSSGMDMSGISIQSAYDAVNLVRKRSRIANEGIMHQDVLPRKLITDYATEVDECVPDWKPGAYGYIYDGVRTAWEYNRYGDDYTAFRTEILNERARELVAESTDRWCDLVRRGILVKQMQAWRQYNPFISNTEREITTPGAPENIQSRNMLLPVPLSEIDVNKNLTQNPGY